MSALYMRMYQNACLYFACALAILYFSPSNYLCLFASVRSNDNTTNVVMQILTSRAHNEKSCSR